MTVGYDIHMFFVHRTRAWKWRGWSRISRPRPPARLLSSKASRSSSWTAVVVRAKWFWCGYRLTVPKEWCRILYSSNHRHSSRRKPQVKKNTIHIIIDINLITYVIKKSRNQGCINERWEMWGWLNNTPRCHLHPYRLLVNF